ncbi:MAG TPA: hypothetical protein VJN62_04450 [Gemmatimonadales bacterium]|nr:hypothetical protein [Gemmatimonadales bacterium]
MVKRTEGWTVVGLMDVLFGPRKLEPLAHDLSEARKRVDYLREVPDDDSVRTQLSRLSREIVREADGRHLKTEGDFASELAGLARRRYWDEPELERLAVGYRRLDRMVQGRIDQLTRFMAAGRNPD